MWWRSGGKRRATRLAGQGEFIDQSGFVNLVVDDERPANERIVSWRSSGSSSARQSLWRCRHLQLERDDRLFSHPQAGGGERLEFRFDLA